ncbi:NAD(P)-binding domain-containing protein [Nonomuraea fuscirosea]|jgi:8-hydroxy-5-deazaflavin:NADPH oxidoreductase|uniref:NADPH-dependent F420 reductase n=1 Tax=Nonomuraea fuscirosea TaxID=1291556 RepID=UPI002DDAE903|nr:NAD(P)-binding domain-containing protein [Nonomuraea fuscirosea]WSA56393.1 NAD(P)-binding domain-containing protein [Nonomuraea fuscirosea]
MRIGIVNTGNIGRALARAWLAAGHEVMVAKDGGQQKLDAFIEQNPRAIRGTPGEAAEFGDVVLFSVYWPRLDAVSGAVGPIDGKIIIDTMNPLQVSSDFEHFYDAAFMARSSTSEELQRRFPRARVVKAFNTIPSNLLDEPLRWFAPGSLPAVFLAGDDTSAKVQVRTLAQDAGFTALDAGPLTSARNIEQLNVLVHLLADNQFEGASDRIAPAVAVAAGAPIR